MGRQFCCFFKFFLEESEKSDFSYDPPRQGTDASLGRVRRPGRAITLAHHAPAFLLLPSWPRCTGRRAGGRARCRQNDTVAATRAVQRTRVLGALNVDLLVCVEDPGHKLVVTQGRAPRPPRGEARPDASQGLASVLLNSPGTEGPRVEAVSFTGPDSLLMSNRGDLVGKPQPPRPGCKRQVVPNAETAGRFVLPA